MATITILKNDGIFTPYDYRKGIIAGKLRDLETDSIQPIRRTSEADISAYLVSEEWWQAKVAAYAAVPTPMPPAVFEDVTDDYLSNNVITMMDIVNNDPQVRSQIPRFNEDGPTTTEAKVYNIIDTQSFSVDDRIPEDDVGDGEVVGGTVVARLLDPVHFQTLYTGP